MTKDFSLEMKLYADVLACSRGALALREQRVALGITPAESPILLHGTSATRYQEILRSGLVPRSERGWQTRPSIALTIEPWYAELYASEAAERDGCENGYLIAVRVDPDHDRTGVDDDFWQTILTDLEENDAKHRAVIRHFVGDGGIRALEELAACASVSPTREHEAELERLLIRGTPMRLCLALRGDARMCVPIDGGQIVGAWRLEWREPADRDSELMARSCAVPGSFELRQGEFVLPLTGI